MLTCTCASGTAMPPFIVLDRKTLNPTFTRGEVPGTLYGLSTNGWMNQDLIHHWFVKHFLQYVPTRRPLILLMDGHSSNYCPETIKMAAENKVILFILPPNTTHLTQPLDRACFAPLKCAWKQECHQFLVKNPGKVVNRLDFVQLFAGAWYKAMTISNITAGFSVTGIYPFDHKVAITKPPSGKSKFKPTTLAERSGLAYIPFYSPMQPFKHKSRTDSYSSTKLHSTPAPHSSLHHSDNSFDMHMVTPIPVKPATAKSKSNPAESSLSTKQHWHTPQRYSTTISKFLPFPKKAPSKTTLSAGVVLTSKENLKKLEEKGERRQISWKSNKPELVKVCNTCKKLIWLCTL